jgi:AraC-like DNA-binding protein
MPASVLISALSVKALLFLIAVLLSDRKRAPGGEFLIALCAVLELIIVLRLCFDFASVLLVWLPFVIFPAMFLYGPMVYAYSRAVLFGGLQDRWPKLVMRGIPLVVLAVHTAMHLQFAELHAASNVVAQSGVIGLYTKILFSCAAVYSLIFVSLAWRNITRYERRYEDEFAGPDEDRLDWLKVFVFLNVFLIVGFCVGFAFIAYYDLRIPSTPFEGGIALVLIYAILFYRVRSPAIFLLPELGRDAAKYEKQNLSAEKRREYLARIQDYLVQEKPFLDDKVTLSELARDVGIPEHHFSMTINIERGMNFFHFINAYRVAEAKSLLMEGDIKDDTVLEVAYRSGFQSKASFNRIFKKVTGYTPSEFRKTYRAPVAG